MVFTGKPERDKISPKIKTAAAQVIINGTGGKEMHACGLYASVIRCEQSRVPDELSTHCELDVPEREDRRQQGVQFC